MQVLPPQQEDEDYIRDDVAGLYGLVYEAWCNYYGAPCRKSVQEYLAGLLSGVAGSAGGASADTSGTQLLKDDYFPSTLTLDIMACFDGEMRGTTTPLGASASPTCAAPRRG